MVCVLCHKGERPKTSDNRPNEIQRSLKAVAGLSLPLVNTASAFASVVVTPDCPAEPEPVVQLLLVALIVGSLFKLKQIILREDPLDTIQDEKFLVAKAKARHRYDLQNL